MSDRLEILVGRALREAPLRPAPSSLESRVLREIGRRAALPWWRRGFSRWPRLARAGFTLVCGSIAAAVLGGTWPWAQGGVLAAAWSAVSPLSLPWARSASTLVDVARELDSALVRVIPLEWLYGTVAAGTILYAALFGLGAAAYRTFYLNPRSAGDSQS
jgi:hypothetical protein